MPLTPPSQVSPRGPAAPRGSAHGSAFCSARLNEQERLALLEAHRASVTAKLAELQENLTLIDHKIDVYQGRLAAGDADQLWAPNRPAGAR